MHVLELLTGMVQASFRVLITLGVLACVAGCASDSGADASATAAPSALVVAAPEVQATETHVAPLNDLATPSPAMTDDQNLGNCGGPSDQRNRIYSCELGDLEAGDFTKIRCNWHGTGDFHDAEVCGWYAPEMVYARDSTNDSPFEAAITHASQGVIFIGDAQQGLDRDNTIRLSILSLDQTEIQRIIDRHGDAAMKKALALWAPVYARYHGGDRGVCVQIVDDSLTKDDADAMGYQMDGDYGSVIITQRCLPHT